MIMQNMGFATPATFQQNRLQKQAFFQNLVLQGNQERMRKAAIEQAKAEQKKAEEKAAKGGIWGAVTGAIGGGITGFVSGGPAGALLGAAQGGMQGYQTGRQTGDATQGALLGAAQGVVSGIQTKEKEQAQALLEAAQRTKDVQAATGAIEAQTKAEKLLFDKQKLLSDKTKDEIKASQELTKIAQSLRKEFSADKIIADANEINSGVNKIKSLWNDYIINPTKKLVAMDQAIITIFNKILDPNSVVRESEYERIPGAAAALDRVPGFIEFLKAGGSKLSTATKAEIVRSAAILANAHNVLAQEKKAFFENEAKTAGLDPQRVTSVFTPLTGLQNLIDKLNKYTGQTSIEKPTKEKLKPTENREQLEQDILNLIE